MYRVIVGKKGNVQGHLLPVLYTLEKAKELLAKELKKYNGFGWGRIEERIETENSIVWRKVEL